MQKKNPRPYDLGSYIAFKAYIINRHTIYYRAPLNKSIGFIPA